MLPNVDIKSVSNVEIASHKKDMPISQIWCQELGKWGNIFYNILTIQRIINY